MKSRRKRVVYEDKTVPNALCGVVNVVVYKIKVNNISPELAAWLSHCPRVRSLVFKTTLS